jgi:WD40 repeat protein
MYSYHGSKRMARLWGTLLALVAGLSLVLHQTAHAEPVEEGQAAPVDAFGDPLPAGARARMGSVRLRQSRGVSFVAFVAEGKELVSAGNDGTVRVWEVATGKELRRFELPGGSMGGGSSSMSSGDIRIVHHYEAPNNAPVILTADGTTLAALGNDAAVHMWDVAKGTKLRRFRLKGDWPDHIVFSPDGKQLASWGDDQVVYLANAVTGQALRQLGKTADENRRVYVGRTGKPLTYSPDGKHIATYIVERDQGSVNGLITIWDTETAKQVRQIKVPHRYYSGTLCYAPDGKSICFASTEGALHFFDPETGKEQRKLDRRDNQHINTLVLAPDGKSFATRESQWGPVLLRDTASGKDIKKFGEDAHPEASGFFTNWSWGDAALTDVAFSPDGRQLAVGMASGAIRLWDVAGGKELLPAGGHQGAVTALFVSADGKTLTSTAADSTLRRWDLATGKEQGRVALPAGAGRAVYSPDGKTFAFGTGTDKLHLWDAATGKERHVFTCGGKLGWALPPAGGGLTLTADGKRLALRDYDGTIRLYDPLNGAEAGKFSIKVPDQPTVAFVNGVAPGIAYTADGSRLAIVGGSGAGDVNAFDNGLSAGNSVVRLWDVAAGRPTLQFESRKLDVLSLTMAPNGWLLGTAHGDGTVSLWETITGKERLRLKTRDGSLLAGVTGAFGGGNRKTDVKLFSLVFSADGRLLAGGGEDRRIHVWDVRTGKKLAALAGHDGPIQCLAFLPDGRGLVSGSADSTALCFDLSALLPEGRAAEELEADRLQALWTDLAADDAGRAYKALLALSGAPQQALPLAREHVKAATGVAPERVRLLLADLESKQFLVRQRATDLLERHAELVEDDLKRALDADPSLEVRKRLQSLLERIGTGAAPPPELLEALRALELLESIGTSEARQTVATIARGVAKARLTREAQAVEQRIAKRLASQP